MGEFPVEMYLMIYSFSDYSTRVSLNKSFLWSYKAVNPLKNPVIAMNKRGVALKLPSIKDRITMYNEKLISKVKLKV
jgi:hypothetical protein